MDPLSVTASIIAILQVTATLVNYANDVKDAPKDRARFAMEASSLSSLLLNLRYQIEEENSEKSNEAWTREVTLLGVPDGPLDQYRHALDKLQVKIVTGKGLVKIGDALWWRFTKEEVAGILLRIERLKSLVQIALQMDHFKLSQAIKTSLDGIYDNSEEIKIDLAVVRSQIPAIQDSVDTVQNSVGAVQESVDAVQHEQDRKKNQVLVEWISSANYSSQQSDFISRREPGTGQWFLDSAEFNKWLVEPSQTLFCPGIPGAGKTMISAITVDHLHKVRGSSLGDLLAVNTGNMPHSDLHGVAHIFCNYRTQSEQNTTSLLSAILKQLVQAKPSAAKAANTLYERHCDHGTRPSVDEIFATLKTTMMSFWAVYVVIDALDECTDRDRTRSQLLDKLLDLQQDFDVRLMFTSRANTDIVSQFKTSLTLEIRASPADVKRYVRGQINRLPKCVQRDEKLQGEVEDKIGEAVDGMFLLARLHVDSLRDKRTKAKVQSMLEMLPKGMGALNEAYDDAIKRIEAQLPDDSKVAKSVLSWITYAQRPLTTGELCHALAVDPDNTDLDEDNILDVEDIVSVCAGLVTVDEESNIVRLVHYTAQEYLLQIREAWNPTAQQEITTTCLTYLSFDPFRSGSCVNDADLNDRIAYYKFLDYASRYWGHHAKTVQEQVSQVAFVFLRDNELVSCVVQTMSMVVLRYTNYGQSFPKYATGLHLTAKFGLQYLLVGLLSGSDGVDGMAADLTDSHGRTPLSWATDNGHLAIIKLLVERDVDINLKDIYGRTPLSFAAREGHEATVKFLVGLDGVDINIKDHRRRTALSWASYKGHRAIAKLLAELEGAEIDIGDREGITPFLCAVQGGAELTVEMFLERKDIDFNTLDIYGKTPLIWAAQLGRENIMKLLLEHDDVKANVNLADRYGQTPLSKAAQLGQEAAVRLLLENEDVVAEVDVGDVHGRTPLSYAAEAWNEATVKLLVERADVNADSKDNSNRTPFWLAARALRVEAMKVLIEREDVAVDSKDLNGQTPLLYAARLGNRSVVKLLLGRHDVNTNSKDRDGYTPLAWAAMEGYEEILKLLLERKEVEADTKDAEGQTPLMWAAELGYEAIVKLLLEREDVNPATKNNLGQTALWLAKRRGRKGIVNLLVHRQDVEAGLTDNCEPKDKDSQAQLSPAMQRKNRSVRVNIKDEDGLTALSWAAQNGCEAIAKLLLERKDVEANTKDGGGLTPLSWAARSGHVAVVKLLLERKDVEADTKDEGGLTPLLWAARNGRVAVVKLLLERKDVEADIKDKRGQTPLSWAARGRMPWGGRGGRESVVELLLERPDVDVNSKDNGAKTPLLWAIEHRNKSVAEILLRRHDVDVDPNDKDGQWLLQRAVRRGDKSLVKLLLQRHNIDANSRDKEGRTPLSWAADAGHSWVRKVEEYMWETRTFHEPMMLNDEENPTPAWRAAARKNIYELYGEQFEEWGAIVELLLEREDIEPDLKDDCGKTPLMWAADLGFGLVVRLLIAREDVDADAKDDKGKTPLMCAAEGGHETIVRLLLELEDVDPAAKNDSGQTALWMAENNGHRGVVKLLRLKLEQSRAGRDVDESSKKGGESQV